MSDLRTAAQQALEALELVTDLTNHDDEIYEAITALRAALAQQAEPVEEPITRLFGTLPVHDTQQALAQQAEPLNLRDPAVQKRLATQWGYVPAAQAEPVEPVGWNWMLDGQPYGQAYYGNPPDTDIAERAAIAGRTVRLLYTAPPQRKPLPKHDQHCVDVPGYGLMAVRLVRAVERAHGIKE